MAFNETKLQKITATTPGVYHYVAPAGDVAADIKAADYFLDIYARLVVGDMIMVADPVTFTGQVLTVSASTSSTVTTNYLTNA
jgi:hypothetical protein